MKKAIIIFLISGLLVSTFPLFPVFSSTESSVEALTDGSGMDLKNEAFEILNAKCNSCHRKQNPFKVFSLKNMEKHAPKIYQQVFVLYRMPKGNKVKLTDQEYQTLKTWLSKQS